MPLLNPPKPEIPKRKYYVKIDEPLARFSHQAIHGLI
jgi:hypothetical protein